MGVFLSECFNKPDPADPRGEAYAGSTSCKKCHQDIYNAYVNSAHAQTSQPASIHHVHGNFNAPFNVFSFANNQKMVMEKTDSGLYQAGYIDGKRVEAHRFDIAFGGVKAETYAYWNNKQAFELPMSYFKALHSWTNSPGYAVNYINFGRPIVTRCFECHSSYIYQLPQQTLNRQFVEYDKNTLIYGVDCERCHGPAAQHVNFQTANPAEKKAHFMVGFKSLTRAQKLDACGVCHGGNADQFQRTAFAFKPGDTLANFKEPDYFPKKTDPTTIDVHGNQNGLLAASKCFLMSNMDCTTCHASHGSERDNVTMYSQRCMNCHNTANHNVCKMQPKLSAAMRGNCIDCHMPAKPSSAILVQTQAEKMAVPYLVHTHLIAVYPEESKKIMAFVELKAESTKQRAEK